MTASTMLVTISAMTMAKMTKTPAYASAITHGDVPATMETMTMNCMKTTVAQHRKSTTVSKADRTMAPIRDVIAIVQKISANCARNSTKTFPNKT